MTRSQYLELLSKGMEMTSQRLAKSPTYGVFIHAAEQLDFIRRLFESNQAITEADLKKIDIGLMAAKELEQSDPAYADILEQLDYYLSKIPIGRDPPTAR